MRFLHAVVVVVAVALASCSSKSKPVPRRPPVAEQRAAATPVIESLRAARFEPARDQATAVLQSDPTNSSAAVARALSDYILAMSQLRREATAVLEGATRQGFDHARMRASMENTLTTFARVRADLDVAAADPGFELELCLACWERDWNHSGEVDERDRLFLQIEIDAAGNEYPEGDPRRKPTFRFDVGDVHWARAMVAYQSAALELILAYKWTELDKLLMTAMSGGAPVIRIELDRPERVATARQLILAGLDASQKTREAYLAETDDDREWVPNPTQKSHPLPLPVDAALYETWRGVLDDLRGLVAGETGLSVAELAQLGDHRWPRAPGGFVDIGMMFKAPKTIVLDIPKIASRFEEPGGRDREPGPDDIEGLLGDVLGSYYVKSMKPSPIVSRLKRMKGELERDGDTFERKLRYLLWLN